MKYYNQLLLSASVGLVLAVHPLAAQVADAAVALPPAIESVEYQITSYFVGNSGPQVLLPAFWIKLAGVSDPSTEIKSAAVSNGAITWNLSVDKAGLDRILGASQGISLNSTQRVAGTQALLGTYRLELGLSSGAVIAKEFEMLPPGEIPDTGAKYLYAESYTDFISPWHAKTLAAPVISSFELGEKTITIKFSVNDRRCANVFFEFIDGDKLVWRSVRMVDSSNGSSRRFLNNGAPLLTDGSTNTAVFDREGLTARQGSTISDTKTVQIIAVDGLRYRGSTSPDKFKYKSLSRPFAIMPERPIADTQVATSLAETIEPTPLIAGEDRSYFAWLLALSGQLSTLNGMDVKGLVPLSQASGLVKNSTEILRGYWGVNSKEDLMRAIEELFAGGHNAVWKSYVAAIESSPGLSDEKILAKVDGRQSQFRLDFVRAHMGDPKGRILLSWDLTRTAMLSRWGYICGYLSADEAWTILERLGPLAASAYDSWEEYGLGYIRGRLFWNGEDRGQGIKMLDEAQNAFITLLAKDGGWTAIPWEIGKERQK